MASTSIFHAYPQLRTAAPRLSRRLFASSSPCLHAPIRCTWAAARGSSAPRPSVAQSVRWKSTQPLRSSATIINNTSNAESAILAQAATHSAPKSSSFPDTNSKSVAYWLLGSAASVFGIVVFGGLTRLTESGLSITEWRPVTGSLWPMDQATWDSEFTKYKSSPEFALLNSSMTMSDFKQIYFMEWAHRLWGRVIGITFLLPTVYFIARKRVTPTMALKLTGICGMIGFQGFIGWWMVKSGLKDDLFAPGSHPRVSQYRLTAHLGAAFTVYCSMVLTGLSILKEHRMLANPTSAAETIKALQHPVLRVFRRSVVGLALLVFTTAMSGALVAGLDAGLIYNEFPWMGLGLTPPKKELFDPFYSHVPDQSDLWWRNMLENPSLVQLDHRLLATTTFTAVMSLFAYTRFAKGVRSTLPKDVKKGVQGMVHLVSLQVALGISTLIYMVPTWLASAHQAGALALLTGAVVLYSRISLPRRAIMRQIMKAPTPRSTTTPHINARLEAAKAAEKTL
ncbi:similar to cytochrome c oxidase assembly protein cox15 [Plenodomus lingam JN3]|uniref:Similar to cytochrome c oxidase assembly protein cox15 n=2 Tax=Leptosphaeria maculans TaxID=5022 RepID=E4ZY92_LEPMJ|nr:similar to cytochrome c oxidase assembly protein cox15 [Plenodomus lingam JN3]CBX96337.1 similar to cytochrome c oxidase assembly protein cox15 [Plenodomus lingam JN3]